MKIKYSRWHKVNPERYESLDFGASIEVDLTEDFADTMSIEEVRDHLDKSLDALLDTAVNRALSLPGDQIQESHVWDYYERD